MTYSDHDALEATAIVGKHRADASGEIAAALAVVGLSATRVERETGLRDDMVRVAHDCGASIRQLAEASGLNRKTITAIVADEVPATAKP